MRIAHRAAYEIPGQKLGLVAEIGGGLCLGRSRAAPAHGLNRHKHRVGVGGADGLGGKLDAARDRLLQHELAVDVVVEGLAHDLGLPLVALGDGHLVERHLGERQDLVDPDLLPVDAGHDVRQRQRQGAGRILRGS